MNYVRTGKNRAVRHKKILARIAEHGAQDVEVLAEHLAVSTMTIRRDLEALQQQGVLVRTHGGCIAQTPIMQEIAFSEKIGSNLAAKSAIASYTAGVIEEGGCVYFDTGTTTLLVARSLSPRMRLSVVTNNIRAALELFGRPQVDVGVLGGELAALSPDLLGLMAIEAMNVLRFDLALLGADAIDVSTGEVAGVDQPSVALSRQAWLRASRVLVLADSSKLGKTSRYVSGTLGDKATLITDGQANAAHLDSLRGLGIAVQVVPVKVHASNGT